ncbi:MAG TPA: hypothetical protein VLC28_00700 [Flavitalea sp.]|nr:hypothetical protein [Flavitalea sp.]
MKKSVLSVLCFALFVVSFVASGQERDLPFKQAVSVKYALAPALKGAVLKKLVIDYNDNAYVLSDKGVLRVQDYLLVKDLRYSALADKQPLDISIREGSGHLYYLYADKVLSNGYAGLPLFNLPKNKFSMVAVAEDGSILLAGNGAVAVIADGKLTDLKSTAGKVVSVHAQNNEFYVRTDKAIYKLKNNELKELHKAANVQAITIRGNDLVVGTNNGYYGINASTGDTTFPLQTKLPVTDIKSLTTINGRIWLGTSEGAFMRDIDGRCRYYASRRWLNEDNVQEVYGDNKGNAYALTATGLNKIDFVDETLAAKAKYFQDKIRQRHIRYGFISNVSLAVPGDLSTARMTDTDNDGLWTTFYLGSQSFRYAVTGEKEAKRYAWEAFEAFERIISINQIKGFPARSFERKGYKVSDPERWRQSPEPEWEWKGHTSSDEFCGYIFVAAVLNEMVAETESEKKRVADFMDKILTHIIDNNYYFIDIDGKPTLWGRWNPEYINSFPETVGDRKLGSTHIIAGLQLGYALTGKEIYKTEAYRLMDKFGYLKNMVVPYSKIAVTPIIHQGVTLGDGWNHSDDEMAFLTYWVLQRYAFTDSLREQYNFIINDHMKMEQPERNSLWNLITLGTAGTSTFDKESTLWHLREYQLDQISWRIKNSHRKDLEFLPPNIRDQTTKELLPPNEQPTHRHNSNAFDLDGGGNGRSELAGDEYLLPYWMARYLRVID